MPARQARLWVAGCLLALIAGLWLHDLAVGTMFLLGSVAAAGWVVAALAHPWLGARRYYRLRYHAPDEGSLSPHAVGRGLSFLAQQMGAVVLVWRREADELTLHIETPAQMAEACEGLLSRLLPVASLEAVPPPRPLSAADFYRWPLTSGAFNFNQLLSEDLLVGDFELRVHLAAGGAAVIVHGTAAPGGASSELLPMWRPLWRFLPTFVQGKRSESNKAGRVRLLRERSDARSIPWPVMLFRCYPLWDEWPKDGSGEAVRPPMYFPVTGGPGTTRLDQKASSVIPLPPGYHAPSEGERILLGLSTADNRPVELPLTELGGHFLVLGGECVEREATVEMLLEQVTGLGGGLVVLDPAGENVRRIAARLPQADRHRRAWIDLENPAGSLRLNLLSVPPLVGRSNSAAAEAAALVSALEDNVPLLGTYLGHMGVSTWSNKGGSALLLDWARLLLIRHHRARIVEDPSLISAAPAPDLGILYELLGEPDTLASLVMEEADAWIKPSAPLAMRLEEAADDGACTAEVVQGTLNVMQERLRSLSTAQRRLTAAGLRDQLRPAMHEPALSRMFRGPYTAPAELLSRSPGAVLLARLPLFGADMREARDVTLARLYGSYIVTCVVAAARWRLRCGQSSPPVLVVLQDAEEWIARGMIETHLQMLGRAGVGVLMATSRLPHGEGGTVLLDNCGTWLIPSLAAEDAGEMRRRLRGLGVAVDLPLTRMPAGATLVKFPHSSGSIVATANMTGASMHGSSHKRDLMKVP
jgi:hypothetical protein